MPGNQTGDDVSVDRAKLEAVVRIEQIRVCTGNSIRVDDVMESPKLVA